MNLSATKKVSIKDVAKKAGVGVSTVSGILNGNMLYSEQTRKLVWDVANMINYSPNSQARGLRSEKSAQGRVKTNIVIHVSHLGVENPIEDTYGTQHSALVSWEAENHGFFPISYRYFTRKGFQCPPVLNGLVDGAIIGSPHLEVINILKEKLPVVLLDVPFTLDNADVSMVNLDIRYGFQMLFKELAEKGHTKLAMVGSSYVPEDAASLENPIDQSILEAASIFGLTLVPEWTIFEKIYSANHQEKMQEIACRLLPAIQRKEITAVVTPIISYAKSLYDIFRESGVRIPEDVSLVGGTSCFFDEPPYGISSIRYNWLQMIDTALDALRSQIDKPKTSPINYLIKPEIYIGTSINDIRTH